MDISHRSKQQAAAETVGGPAPALDHSEVEDRLRRRGVELDIAGADLMLRGRFAAWDSGLQLGSNLDRVGVQMAVDATSASWDDKEPPLFSFRSRSVEAGEAPGLYLARGVLTGSAGPKPTELEIRTPPGHSALFVLSFTAEKADFGDGWRQLIEKAAPWGPPAEGEPVRQAYAWLLRPVLAAA